MLGSEHEGGMNGPEGADSYEVDDGETYLDNAYAVVIETEGEDFLLD